MREFVIVFFNYYTGLKSPKEDSKKNNLEVMILITSEFSKLPINPG